MPVNFTPNNWQTGDTITAPKMNNPESALSNTVTLVNSLETQIGNIPTITVGTTTTGAAGSQASVTNSGTAPDVTLNFTIPAGETGPQGEQGPAGADGADGDPGAAGTDGLSVTAISLALTTTDGAVTGGSGTATMSDSSTINITVTVTEGA